MTLVSLALLMLVGETSIATAVDLIDSGVFEGIHNKGDGSQSQ